MTTAHEAAAAVLRSMGTPPATNGNIKWDCRADGCYRDHLPDWSPLNDCFPRSGIRISDIDGMVEVGNHFLFIEWKMPNVPVPEGQLKALIRLTRLPGITVLVLWGRTTTDPESWQVIHGGNLTEPTPITYSDMHGFVSDWANTADTQPQPRPTASQPRPASPETHRANRVPTLRPGPFRDAGDAGRALASDAPETDDSGRATGRASSTDDHAA